MYALILLGGMMRIIFLLFLTFNLFTQEEEESSLGYVLLSTYEMAAGTKYSQLEKNLVNEAKSQIELGYDGCVLYRHAQGAQRAFYLACFFQTMEQLGKILSKPNDTSDEKQLFASHTDHILAMDRNELEGPPNFIVFAKWLPAPMISWSEWGERMEKVGDAYSKAFGGCDGYGHAWGGEMGNYLVCGFDNWNDFAKKAEAVTPYLAEANQGYDNIGTIGHSDDLLVRVFPAIESE